MLVYMGKVKVILLLFIKTYKHASVFKIGGFASYTPRTTNTEYTHYQPLKKIWYAQCGIMNTSYYLLFACTELGTYVNMASYVLCKGTK